MSDIYVTKRNGRRELLNVEKINEVIDNACEGLRNVSPSDIAMKAHIQFYDGITTSDIQEMIIKSAKDLISEFAPDYSKAAARSLVFHIRKQVFGQYEYPDFYEHVTDNVELYKYDPEILQKYTESEIRELGNYLDTERDCDFDYAAMVQLEGKYLVQDKRTGQKFEAPQQLYMLVAMCLFQEYPEYTRLDYVKRFYDATSLKKLSLPTPIMAGVRTPTRQFSSCTLIDCDDKLASINATSSAIVEYASKRAGIGINGGKIRALGSPIRGGEAVHTGVIGFYKYFQSALKSCSQGGVRGASSTLYYPWWHPEINTLLVLKNNKGTEDNRVRHMDYAIQANRFFYEKAQRQEDVCLFNPSEVEDMYEAFFVNQEAFVDLYNKYSQDPAKVIGKVKAYDILTSFADERAGTGRIYLQNVDHTNDYGVFNPKYSGNTIRMSNLCVAPETKILTKEGYQEIAPLEGKTLDIWNGEEWSEVTVEKTGVAQELIEVPVSTYKEGKYVTINTLRCTPYHKFYDEYGNMLRAFQLTSDTRLLSWEDSEGYLWTHCVGSLKEVTGVYDTYCFKEKKRGMAVFNGILTGQCAEITLPTTPLMHIDDDKGEIALCTLAAFNLGNPTLFEDLPELSDLIVRALDSLLDYQDYPVKAAEKNKLRRTLGVGVVNTAYYIAKNGKKYSDGSANNLVHELFESIQYNLLKASCGVAKEQGACEWFHKTKYAQGIMPVDNYKKEVDNYHSAELLCDWPSLREDILKYGLRNSTLTALMPSETSSQISNATNGIEPPRALSTTKASKDSYFKQVVPDVLDLWLDYELIWDMPDNKGYLTLCGIMQKFVDQSISANTNYDPNKFKDRKVPLQLILEDLYLSYRLGVKTLYYHNTRDGSGEDLAEDDGCESGACKI